MNKRTIDGIRKYYKLPQSVTDEQIKTERRGSIGEAVVNINNAIADLKKAFHQDMPEVCKKCFRS